MLQIAALVVAAVALLINTLTHRFQRATLALANLHTQGTGDRNEIGRLQLAMMPDWMGHIILLEYGIALAAATLLYFAFPWWVLIILTLAYLGLFSGICGSFLPFMPHSWNLKKIESHLDDVVLRSTFVQRLPVGSSTDESELLSLASLVSNFRMDCIAGNVSLESIAAGNLK